MLSDYGLLEFQYKKPSQLSGGMRQRAALIRTMALEPDILLLDEPFSALDYQTRLTVSADIAAMIRKAEKSVILITHDLAEAISLADRVLILSARPARVKAEFPIHLTAADHSPLAALLFLQSLPCRRLLCPHGFRAFPVYPYRYHVD